MHELPESMFKMSAFTLIISTLSCVETFSSAEDQDYCTESPSPLKIVELWDRNGLTGFIDYSEGCEGDVVRESLHECFVELRISDYSEINPSVNENDYLYFLQTYRRNEHKTMVSFTNTDLRPETSFSTHYNVSIKHDATHHTYPVYLDPATFPAEFSDHPELLPLSLSILPPLHEHFCQYLIPYSLQHTWLDALYLPSELQIMISRKLNGQNENEYIIKLAECYSLGFRFDQFTNTLDRVAIYHYSCLEQNYPHLSTPSVFSFILMSSILIKYYYDKLDRISILFYTVAVILGSSLIGIRVINELWSNDEQIFSLLRNDSN